MLNKNIIILVTGLYFLALAGCAPITPFMTKSEREEFVTNSKPYLNDVIYDQALSSIGEYINKEISYKKIIQSKNIGNTAGGDELPYNLTNMVITSLSRIAGKKLIIAPYDPEYINNDAITGGAGSRILPNLVIAGSITEFDKDIDATEKDIDLDLLLDKGAPNTTLGFGYSSSKKMSRITLDLYLLDYKTHAVIPGVSITNTVNVLELKKGQNFGFAIYGSGIGIGGRINHTHGFHRAVRNLVDYSILQLMGRYYNIPYWRALGISESDPDVMDSMKSSFARKNTRKQIIIIQKLLNTYPFDTVLDPANERMYKELIPDGTIGKRTKAYINRFNQEYSLETSEDDLEKLFVQLVDNLPLNPHLDNSGSKQARVGAGDDSETTSSQKFFDSLDRVDRVFQIPAIIQ